MRIGIACKGRRVSKLSGNKFENKQKRKTAVISHSRFLFFEGGTPKPYFQEKVPELSMKSFFFFSYISVTVYRIQENCEQNMFSALKNPKEYKEKEKE